MSSPYTTDAYPLVELVQQEAVSVESSSVNGRQQNVYVVVKNQPFNIKLRALHNGASTVNFQNTTIQAKLFYDCDPPKAVDFIRDEPLQYVGTVSPTGNEVSVEVKLAILSSQHQGSLFLVMLRIMNNSNSESLCVLSHPIRIVSKIDHIRKEGIPIKKKTCNEILTDRLRELEQMQDEQTRLIQSILETKNIPFETIKAEPNDSGEPTSKKKRRSTDPRDIQGCFNKVVSCFKNMSEEERPEKIRKILKELKQEDIDQVVEAFGSDLRDFKPAAKKDNNNGECTCSNCPARKELQNYNNFYSNFMAASSEIKSPKGVSANSHQAFMSQLGMLGNPALMPFAAQSPSLGLSNGAVTPPGYMSQVVPQMPRFQHPQPIQKVVTHVQEVMRTTSPMIVQDQALPAEPLPTQPRAVMRAPPLIQESCEIPTTLHFPDGPLDVLSEVVPDSLPKW